ncbi:MAG: hypothetical protein KIT51_10090 [Cyclobacteriaceae bacterium]|nr:MAG: hypothetical protein KIT51_10090 [Cyclobacteriaceae bacterium]
MREFTISRSDFDAIPDSFKRELIGIFRELLAFEGYVIRIDNVELKDRDSLADWILENGYALIAQ